MSSVAIDHLHFADVYTEHAGCPHELRWSIRELLLCGFTWKTLPIESLVWALLVTYLTEWLFDDASEPILSRDVV